MSKMSSVGSIRLIDEPRAVGEIFNIGGNDEISMNDLAARVKAITGSSSPIRHIPYDQAYQEGFEDMERRVPDITKIEKLIGYKNTYDLDAILAKVVAYERTAIRYARSPRLHADWCKCARSRSSIY